MLVIVMKTKINLYEKIKEITNPWTPIEIARVNNQVVRLSLFKGTYPMHKHDKEDELFFVYEGEITIEFEDGSKINLNKGEIAVIPKGILHSPNSNLDSYVLMFEPQSLKSRGD